MAVRKQAAHSRNTSVSTSITPNRSALTTTDPPNNILLTPSSVAVVADTKSDINTNSTSSTHHHRAMSKITATNTPRKRDDISAHSTPNARKASFSTASAFSHDSETKETKDHHHRRTESESVGGNAAPMPRSRRPSVGGPPPRSSVPKATTARERGPNFLANFDPERFICRPPKNFKKKKAKAGEKTKSDQHGLSRLDLAELWRHYDKNENGMLDANEMEELAEDIIDRVPALYKEVLRRDKPSASESHLDEMVAGDLPEIMPGSKSAIAAIMAKELPSNYPQNRKIREHEFTARWNHVAQLLFSRMYSTENTGALQCVIL